MKNFLMGIVFTVLVIVVGGYGCMKKGYVDFKADQQPSFLERHFAMEAMDASTDRHAPEAKNPESSAPPAFPGSPAPARSPKSPSARIFPSARFVLYS